MLTLNLNGVKYDADVEPDTPLLWVIRDTLGMTGTKYGCGIGQCGCCTVHVDGEATRSCVTPVESVVGKDVTTIEGFAKDRSHPVLVAWVSEGVPQCGYCQPGQIMAAAALLKHNPKPSDEVIDQEMTNICRCGTYTEIRKAIHRASALMTTKR